MKILGLQISRARDIAVADELVDEQKDALSSVRSAFASFMGVIREPFTGAWQRNIEADCSDVVAAFGAVYACITRIAADISSLRMMLVERMPSGIWTEVVDRASPFLPVLRKPNNYQTRIQFLSMWIVTKLLYGNAYILKERDKRGIVTELHVIDPRLVDALSSSVDGSVWYRIRGVRLAGVPEEGVTVPASEIIHDRTECFFHPLIGMSPIWACGISATQGRRIQANSARFFENMSRPSGMLTAPGKIDEETETRLKMLFEQNFSGGGLGRLFVAGSGLKYEAMGIPAEDAQLIEQLEWTVKDVGACFHMPLYKIGAGPVPVASVGSLNQSYYDETLRTLIEPIELLLAEGLGVDNVPDHVYGIELDVEALLRMDPIGRADYATKLVGAGIMSPNEARSRENLPPVDGGESPKMQQQQFSLAALDQRDRNDPFSKPEPAPAASPAASPGQSTPPPAEPPPDEGKQLVDFVRALADRLEREALTDAA